MKLSRLPRLPRVQSISVKAHGNASPFYLERANAIDRTHPAFKQTINHLPSYTCPQFTIRALPNAVLQEPANYVPINPMLATGIVRARRNAHGKGWWSKIDPEDETPNPQPTKNMSRLNQRPKEWSRDLAAAKRNRWLMARRMADARVAGLAESGRRNLSLTFRTHKKNTSKFCVIRRRLRTKITTAIRLVVSRGAGAVDAPESDEPRPEGSYPPLKLITDPLPEQDNLVLQGWTYLVVPDLSLYRMPMPNIVQHIRKALPLMMQRAHHLEETWASQKATMTQKPQRPPQRTASPRPRPRLHTPLKQLNQNSLKPPPILSSPLDAPDSIHTSSEPDAGLIQTLTPLPQLHPRALLKISHRSHPPRPTSPSGTPPPLRRPGSQRDTPTPGSAPVKRARPSALPRMFARPPVILPYPKQPTDDDVDNQ